MSSPCLCAGDTIARCTVAAMKPHGGGRPGLILTQWNLFLRSPVRDSGKWEYFKYCVENSARFVRALMEIGNFGEKRVTRSPHLPGFSSTKNNILQDRDWLAGAGGLEPPNDGIKIQPFILSIQTAF